jgi:hypothetical protein
MILYFLFLFNYTLGALFFQQKTPRLMSTEQALPLTRTDFVYSALYCVFCAPKHFIKLLQVHVEHRTYFLFLIWCTEYCYEVLVRTDWKIVALESHENDNELSGVCSCKTMVFASWFCKKFI